MEINIPTYLARIRYEGSLSPSAETLRGLQRAHLFSVPFENLDIHLNRPIRLEEAALFDKIVTRRRGGFCYELNGLFARLLESLGFQVARLNARGVNDDGSYSMEYDHLALEVHAPDAPQIPWLVDVGWGNGPLEPLRLDQASEQTQDEGAQDERVFRFGPAGEYTLLSERVTGEDGLPRWIKHYVFTRQPHALEDFREACQHQQYAPESFFRKKRMCSLFLPDGRVTLAGLRLITTRGGTREERELSEEEARRVLKEQFGMEIEG